MVLNWVLELRHNNIESVPANLRQVLIGKDHTFGRHVAADVLVPTKYLSRKRLQCKIIYRRKMLQIITYSASPRDFPNTPGLSSDENSTYLNREPLVKGTVYTLKEGDVIGMGVHELFNKDSYLYEVTRKQLFPVVKTEVEENDDDVVVISDSDEEQECVGDAMSLQEVQQSDLAIILDSHRPLPTRRSFDPDRTIGSETSSQASDSTVMAPCHLSNGPSTSREGLYAQVKPAQTPAKQPDQPRSGNSVQNQQAEQPRMGNVQTPAEHPRSGITVQNQQTDQPRMVKPVQTPSKQPEQSRSGNTVQNQQTEHSRSGNTVQALSKPPVQPRMGSVPSPTKQPEQPRSSNTVQNQQTEQPRSGSSVQNQQADQPRMVKPVQTPSKQPEQSRSGNTVQNQQTEQPRVANSHRHSKSHNGDQRKSSVESLIDVSDDSLVSTASEKQRRQSLDLLEDVSDDSLTSMNSDKAKSSHHEKPKEDDKKKSSGKHSSKMKHRHESSSERRKSSDKPKKKHSSGENVDDSDKKSKKKHKKHKHSSKEKHSSRDQTPVDVSDDIKNSSEKKRPSSKHEVPTKERDAEQMDVSDGNKKSSEMKKKHSSKKRHSSRDETPMDVSDDSKKSSEKRRSSSKDEVPTKKRNEEQMDLSDDSLNQKKHFKKKKRKSSSSDKEATKAKRRKTEEKLDSSSVEFIDAPNKTVNKNNLVSSSDEEDIEVTRLKIKQERRLKKLKRKCKPCVVKLRRLTKAEISVWTTKKKNRKRVLQIVSDVESSPEKTQPPKTDKKPKIVKQPIFSDSSDDDMPSKKPVEKEPVPIQNHRTVSTSDDGKSKKSTSKKVGPKSKVPVAGPSSINHRRRTDSSSGDERPSQKSHRSKVPVAGPCSINHRRRTDSSSGDERPKKSHRSKVPGSSSINHRRRTDSSSGDERPSKKSHKSKVPGPSSINHRRRTASTSDDDQTSKKSHMSKVPVAGPSSVGNHRLRTNSTSDDERPKKKGHKSVAGPIGDRRRSTVSSSDEGIVPKKLIPRKIVPKSKVPVAGAISAYRRSIEDQPSIKTLPRIPKKKSRLPEVSKDLKRSLESPGKSNKKQKVDSDSDSSESMYEVVLPKKQPEPDFKLQKVSKDQTEDHSSDSAGSVYEFIFKEPPCEEFDNCIEIKKEPEEIKWDDSQYTLNDDDDDVVIIEPDDPVEPPNRHSTSIKAESNFDDEFNLFFSSQREELNNSQAEGQKSDSDSDFDMQPRKPMSEQKKMELFFSTDEESGQEDSCSGQEESRSGQEESGSGQDEEPKSPEASGSSDDEKKKREGPVLIDALPLVPRKRGRQNKISTKAKERKEKILRRVSAEDRMNYQPPMKPKAAFTDKMRNLKGQKVVNKNSNWMPDYDVEDKVSKKLMKEQRMKRLKELSKANKQEVEVPKEPEPSTSSAYVEPCVPTRDEGSTIANKIPVKVTKVNRGSFLTELPQKAAKSNAHLDTSVEKIIVDDQVIVIKKSKTQDPPQSKAAVVPSKAAPCPASIPPTSQLVGSESKVAAPTPSSHRPTTSVAPPTSHSSSERKEKAVATSTPVSHRPTTSVAPPTSHSSSEIKEKAVVTSTPVSHRPTTSVAPPTSHSSSERKEKAVVTSTPVSHRPTTSVAPPTSHSSSERKEKAVSTPTPVSHRPTTSIALPPSHCATERSTKEETVRNTVLPVPREEVKPVLPSVSGVVPDQEDAALPSVSNLTLKEELKPKKEEPRLPLPRPVLPGRSCLAGRRPSAPRETKRCRFKPDDEEEYENALIHYYPIEEGKLMKPIPKASMLRHQLPDVDNNTVVFEEMHRVVHTMLYWQTKWLSQELQTPSVPPPVWRREFIHYTDPQLMENTAPRIKLTPEPDRSVAGTKLPWPANSTTQYGSYEAYHKVWLPLMLLEMWSGAAMSSKDPILRQSIFSGDLSNWRTEEINKLRRCNTVHFVAPLTQEMSANTNSPNHGDFVIINLLQDNSRDALRYFGYVEKRRLNQDLARNTNRIRLHPENMKPIVATLELDIKLRYRNNHQTSTKAQVQLLTNARPTLNMMQGLFQLQNSALRDVILAPTLQNMSHTVPVKRSSPFLPTLREMLKTDISLEQEKVAESISNLLKCDQPSLSVIEGPPGTGKTRTLIAITLKVLQDYMYAAQNKIGVQPNEAATLGSRLGTRILILTSTIESMNIIAHLLEFCNKNNSNKSTQNLKFVVIAKSSELCSESSRRNSLQELCNRATVQEDPAEGEHLDWQTEVSLIEAKVHQERIEVEHARLNNRPELPQLEDTLRELEERLEQTKALGLQPDKVLKQVQQDNRVKQLLHQTQIIVTTVHNLAGSSICKAAFNTRCSFQLPICLIDDAHNISEIESLLPLTFGACKIVLAGDLSLPPPTMHCKVGADKLGMSQSLLLRVTKALDSQLRPPNLTHEPKYQFQYLHQNLAAYPHVKYHILRQQQRMPLELTYLTMFYYEKGRMERPEHSDKQWPFLPFTVIDHQYCQNQKVENWRSMEVGLVVNLVRYIQHKVHKEMPEVPTNIIVITVEDIMYNRINYELKHTPRPPNSNDWVRMVDECTSDGNVVILSLGAAEPEQTKVMQLSYFLQAITRAKNSLYIVGNLDKYKHKAHWRALLHHASKDRCISISGMTPFNPRLLEIRSAPHRPRSPTHHRGYAPSHHSRGHPRHSGQRPPTPPFRGPTPQPRIPSPPPSNPNYRTIHVRPNYVPLTDPRRPPNRPPLLDRPPNQVDNQQQNQSGVNQRPPDNDFMPINTLQSFLSFGGPNNPL